MQIKLQQINNPFIFRKYIIEFRVEGLIIVKAPVKLINNIEG